MIRLSNRQHPMLRTFAEGGLHWYMPIEDAQKYDQRPFRSMLIQKWIAYRPGRGFHVTREGIEAWSEFQQTEILRKNPFGPLTAYFDPTAYGLQVVSKRPHAA
jgi:hypothetical protein